MSWASNLTKGQRRELRRVAALAYDRELAQALSKLEEEFGRWRAGEIGPHELNDRIHEFHQGPSRELWSLYTQDHGYFGALAALRRGIVSSSEVESELAGILKGKLEIGEE